MSQYGKSHPSLPALHDSPKTWDNRLVRAIRSLPRMLKSSRNNPFELEGLPSPYLFAAHKGISKKLEAFNLYTARFPCSCRSQEDFKHDYTRHLVHIIFLPHWFTLPVTMFISPNKTKQQKNYRKWKSFIKDCIRKAQYQLLWSSINTEFRSRSLLQN